MTPRTIDFASDSGASRTPRRRRSSTRICSRSSCCTVAAGVRFSKGRMAIVSISGGSPPPLKPYGKWQAAANSRIALTIDMPDRCIEVPNGFCADDMHLQGTTRSFLPILEVITSASLDPLDNTAAFNVLESENRISAEGDSPGNGPAEVSPQDVALLANGRVPGN